MTEHLPEIVRQELAKMVDGLREQVEDPGQRVAIAAMAVDLAMLPVRVARGEDVAPLAAALKAEALNRSLEMRVRAETLAQQTWISVVTRILAGVLA